MGEAKDKGQEAAPAPAGGGSGKMIIMMAVTSLISVAVALAIVYFVILPKLSTAPKGEEGGEEEVAVAEPAAEGEGGGGEGEGESKGPPSLNMEFDEGYATVLMPSADVPSSLLQYKVSVKCGNENARKLIEANKDMFTAKIREIHSYKKHEDLLKPQTEKDIEKQIMQDCNGMLQELLGKPSEKTRIVGVVHTKFFVQDM